MSEKTEKLFDQFPGVSMEEWRAKVVADLKGADFDKKLVWRTNEGFNVQPMYRAEDIADLKTTDSLPGEFPYVRHPHHQRLAHPPGNHRVRTRGSQYRCRRGTHKGRDFARIQS